MDQTLSRAFGNNDPGLTTAAGHLDRARKVFAAYKMEILCAGVLVAMAVILVTTTARKSITTDEIVLIPSAYYHLVTNDVQLIPQHPPLCKLLAGLPLLFIQPNEWAPAKIDPAGPADQNEWNYTMHFWQDNRAQFEAISFWTRIPMVGLTLALGSLVYIFARDLSGPRTGLLAVVLFALEPTILAHGRIVQTDIPAAFGFLLSVFALYRYLRAPDYLRAAGLGAAAAVAMLAKYSMLIIGPALVMTAIILLWRKRPSRMVVVKHASAALLVLLLVINAAYFFHHRPLTPGDLKWIAGSFPLSHSALTTGVRVLRWLLPTEFVLGIYWQLHHSHVGHPAGLLGMQSNHGWWYYFPVAFALKATIPFLVLCVAAIVWATRRALRHHDWRWLWLLVPLAIYTALLMASPINIGVRYFLPGYVLLVMLAAAFANSLLHRQRRAATAVAVIALLWIGVEAARTYPDYTPYMNQLAFAHPHWWYLSDSNVEWGDDAGELAAYLHAHGENRVRGLLLGCFATLDFYRVNYVDALGATTEPPPRYTALGASFLNGSTVPPYEVNGKRVSDETRVNTFASYRDRVPEAVIGNSIYVYRTGE